MVNLFVFYTVRRLSDCNFIDIIGKGVSFLDNIFGLNTGLNV